MNVSQTLPVVKKKKKIDLKKFNLLAKKVRESFEEEEKYIKEEMKRDENYNPSGFLSNP